MFLEHPVMCWMFFFLEHRFKLLTEKHFRPDLEEACQAAGVLGGKRPLACSHVRFNFGVDVALKCFRLHDPA
jgi:hypothetical protein